MYYTQNGPSSYTDYFRKSPSKHLQTGFLSTKDDLARTKFSDTSMLVLDTSELSIKPAFSRPEQPVAVNNYVGTPYVPEKDKNSILSVMMRKGIKPQVVIKPDTFIPKEDKKAGPAQAKLKAMLGKPLQKASKIQPTSDRTTSKRQQLKKSEPSDIGEEINEEFDEYANESFDKLSGAYESIRESIIGESIIRQSMAGESNNVIKESIRQSIRESLASSSSRIKESIREDIRESLQDSNRSFKEEIIEEISGSNRKSKESIEEVYQENFQEESLSNSVSKSHSKFKKSQKLDESLSQSASKSFRMKTNIAKSLKYAEELSKKEKERLGGDDKKITESLDKQKQNIKRIQENIAKLLTKKPTIFAPDKNKDLYYNFKIEINKLLTGDQFQSRLKKLVSFLNVGDDILPNKQYINDLEDNILKNVLGEIRNIKVGQSQLDELERLKKEYEAKLTDQLRMQEVNLRAQMNQKLSEKDMQLKKMIAELQSRMMARTFQPGNYYRQDHAQSRAQYEVESDYSIDSENISWKADLWQLLPEYEKKKLYEKQTAEVTKFLADVMINEIKEEALERSLDISFEFPEEYNISLPEQPPRQEKSQSKVPERSFTKKESEAKHERSSDFLSDLPKISTKKATPNEDKSFTSSKDDYETKFQPVRKDQKIKTDVIKILSQYKTIYLKKKLEVIKNLLKVLTSKDAKTQNNLYSSIQQLTILTQRQFKKEHQLFVRAYEEELIMSLVNIYTRSLDRKQTVAESQMKNMYDRLVVVCQVATAEKCTQRVSLDAEKDAVYNVEALTKEALKKMEASPCPIEIIASENYMELKTKKEEKQVKNELVQHIVNILSAEFAKEFPKKKK